MPHSQRNAPTLAATARVKLLRRQFIASSLALVSAPLLAAPALDQPRSVVCGPKKLPADLVTDLNKTIDVAVQELEKEGALAKLGK